jgi:tetratricopeptide (TPR) repeat protein
MKNFTFSIRPVQRAKTPLNLAVIPAKAGIQSVKRNLRDRFKTWIPAFAGMTTTLGIVFLAVSVFAQTDPDEVLRFGAGARDIAMGKSMVAGARGASALYWNPALLAESGFREAQAFHATFPSNFTYTSVGYVHPFRESLGFGAQLLQYGQSGATARDAAGEETGSFSESQTALTLGAGMKGVILPNLDVGLSADTLHRTMAGRASLLSGLNTGFAYHFLDRRAALGLAAKNMLTMSTGQTSDKLPFRTDLGGAYEFFPGATAVLTFKDMSDVAAGLEWVLAHRLALRLGDAGGGDFSAGIGLLFQRAHFDITMTPNRADGLGSTIASSLSYSFGDDWAAIRRRSALKSEDKARELLRDGQWVAAVNALQKAMSMDPANTSAANLLLRLKSALSSIRVSKSKHERELRGLPEWRLLQIALNEQLEGTPLRAQLLVAYASMKRPNEFRYRSLLAHFETVSGFQALTAEQKSLSPEAFLTLKRNQTEKFFTERNLGEALRECQEIVLLEPASVQDLERLGSLYFAINQNDLAVETFQKALKIDPKNTSIQKFMKEKGLKLKTRGE